MNLHEYQTKEILKKYAIPIPNFIVASNINDLKSSIQDQGLESGVVKVQVHAGGRGKAGGVKIARSSKQLIEFADNFFNTNFKNHQTSGREIPVNKILVSELVDIREEYYLSVILDRETASPMIMVSRSGGVDIETELEKHPEKLLKIPIPHYGKIYNYQFFACAKFLGWSKQVEKQGRILLEKLIKVFLDHDAGMLEVNPLVLTDAEKLTVLDAKMSIDDNALYRHPLLQELFDPSQETKEDVLAREIGVSYVSLKGSIGCLVNGAGLAMGTMDMLDYYGGKPANFLDVGGSASKQQLMDSLNLILSDSSVTVVLINIFGGILDCSVLAQSLVDALASIDTLIPFVIRLEGTNFDKGKEIFKNAHRENLFFADSIEEGAKKAVSFSKGKS